MATLSSIPRRRVLAVGAGAAFAASAVPLLGACSTGTGDENSAERNAKTKLPNYIPFTAIDPDLPGNDKGAMPAYFKYPRDTKQAIGSPPAEGFSEITALYPTFNPVPPAVDKNEYWQAINKALGTSLKLNIATSGTYTNKFQTTIAGGDIPELAVFSLNTPDQPKILDRLFADLGEFLIGDAVKDYPFLANIPQEPWKYTIANGSIFAVPQPRAVSGAALFYNEEIISQTGANPAPKNFAEFQQLAEAVTDAKKNRWAFGNPGQLKKHLLMMLGLPNTWSVSGGKFTNALTDERYKQVIGIIADFIKKGVFHPDSAGSSFTVTRDFFTSGKVALHGDGYAAWDLFVGQMGEKVNAIVEPKYDGGGDAAHHAGIATQAVTAIRKDLGKDKIKKMLNVLNWLAAPIGTSEHLLRKFGVEGTHFTWDGDAPKLTDKGKMEKLDVQYITDSPTILGPGPQERITKQHEFHVRVTKNVVYDASVGLFSDTLLKENATLLKNTGEVEQDIIYGRKPLSDWDDAVKKWKSEGGDTAATELAAAYETANK